MRPVRMLSLAMVLLGCGGAPATGPAARPTDGPATRLGEFDQQAVVRMIHTHRHEIQACYERELAATPSLVGRIAVQMTIAESGAVEGVHVADTTMAGGEVVAACVVAVVDAFEFDPGPTGGNVSYTFPFAFEPQR